MTLYINMSLYLNSNIVNAINKTWIIWEKKFKQRIYVVIDSFINKCIDIYNNSIIIK